MFKVRGRESTTLKFVTPAVILVFAKYLISGMTLPILGQQPAMTATEFGTAFAAILAVWVAREWKDKDVQSA